MGSHHGRRRLTGDAYTLLTQQFTDWPGQPNTAGHTAAPAVKQTDKILDGTDAPADRFPYLCTLRDPDLNEKWPFCAGTLIHPQLVLTGLNYEGTDVRKARDFAQHPRYNLPKEDSNDVGLIWLDSPANNTPVVQVVSQDQWAAIEKAKPKLWGAGWGRTGFAKSDKRTAAAAEHPKALQQFEGPLLDIAKCNNIYDGEVDVDSQICVGGPGTCKGDSGGPMVYVPDDKTLDDPSTHVQPDIDAKVASFHDWIQQAMEEVEQAGGDTDPMGYTKAADAMP
ncbi:hypothetical protein N2152v2_004484 [Parachlorella kessleri]